MPAKSTNNSLPENEKIKSLESNKENSTNEFLTTNTGLRINDDQNTLKAGERGPSLLEDFHFREKMTHFDHERIPERVVHARGSIQIDGGLAAQVAYCIGVHIPKSLETPLNQVVPADADPEKYNSLNPGGSLIKSDPLNMANTSKDSIRTRKPYLRQMV